MFFIWLGFACFSVEESCQVVTINIKYTGFSLLYFLITHIERNAGRSPAGRVTAVGGRGRLSPARFEPSGARRALANMVKVNLKAYKGLCAAFGARFGVVCAPRAGRRLANLDLYISHR